MANGKPGDHPLTDMLSYGSASRYPNDIFELVRQLAAMPGFASVSDEVGKILWHDWPHWENVRPDFQKVRNKLEAVRRSLGESPPSTPAG
jgi:hypothetical protein